MSITCLALKPVSAEIIELSSDEIFAVFGGTSVVPPRLPPGACPPGFMPGKATYDGDGNLVSVECYKVKTDLTKRVEEVVTTGEKITRILNDVGEWVTSWF